MKNFVISVSFFFLFVFSLSAQYDPISHESNIYILPVTGTGGKAARTYIYNRMNYETAYQNYLLLWGRPGSDYVVRSRIERGEEKGEFSACFTFMLARTNKILSERFIIFNEINEDLGDAVMQIMTDFFKGNWDDDTVINLIRWEEPEIILAAVSDPRLEEREGNAFFPVIPAGYDFSEDWRDRVVFFKYSLLWRPVKGNNIIDEITAGNLSYLNLGLNFLLEAQILSFLSMELGAQVTLNTDAQYQIYEPDFYNDILLELPLAVKIVFKPFKNIMIEPFAGIYYLNYSIINNETIEKLPVFFGIEFDIKIKNAIFVIEPRFAMDMDGNNQTLQLGIGFKHGYITKLAKI